LDAYLERLSPSLEKQTKKEQKCTCRNGRAISK
jgi:hypothetical protein